MLGSVQAPPQSNPSAAPAGGSPSTGPNSAVGLAQRKQALIQSMMRYHPFNNQTNIPGQQDLSPPIQMIYTGYASGAAQQGVPAAQTSSTNPNMQALSNIRGGY